MTTLYRNSFCLIDGGYGNFDKEKKQWNGLIRHLLDRVRFLF